MKKILLSLAFLAGVSLTVSAQFKIGGKTINTKKVINAATDVAHAATLSDEDVAKMAKEYIKKVEDLTFGYAAIIGEVIPRSLTPIIIH